MLNQSLPNLIQAKMTTGQPLPGGIMGYLSSETGLQADAQREANSRKLKSLLQLTGDEKKRAMPEIRALQAGTMKADVTDVDRMTAGVSTLTKSTAMSTAEAQRIMQLEVFDKKVMTDSVKQGINESLVSDYIKYLGNKKEGDTWETWMKKNNTPNISDTNPKTESIGIQPRSKGRDLHKEYEAATIQDTTDSGKKQISGLKERVSAEKNKNAELVASFIDYIGLNEKFKKNILAAIQVGKNSGRNVNNSVAVTSGQSQIGVMG
jgi:hypothetical protein